MSDELPRLDGYEIDILVHGFPGKSVCHGGLGWSSVVLIRCPGRVALVDAGSFGMRRLIIEQLARRGLTPADVTDLLLTHSHYDHSVNWTLFSHARIAIAATELDWSLTQPWGETPVPELYMRELAGWKSCHRFQDGEEVFPGMTAHLAPGHTPGCTIFLLKGRDRDIIFTGDAAKNRAELISREADMTFDPAVTRRSIETIWALWRAKPGNVVVPGHDLPMQLRGDEPAYLGRRRASIKAWFQHGIDQMTEISLTEPAGLDTAL